MFALRVAALALLLVVAMGQPTPGQIKDREGLLALKSKITSNGTSLIQTWRASGNPCAEPNWAHVTCRDGRVVKLDLANRGIVGTLPVGLRKASALEEIDLSNNRFTGKLPEDWAKGNQFTKLKVLKLANNELNDVLPNWNRKGCWRSLETLDLSGNQFSGPLPNTWLGKQKPIRNVKYLDLSNNLLGQGSTKQDDWCKPETWSASGVSYNLLAGSGWCPVCGGTCTVDQLVQGTAASLTYLDLSNNDLTGYIPDQWPLIFQRLQYLNLQFNQLFTTDDGTIADTDPTPAALPKSWTSDRQKGFPALATLTLYPGNDYICSIMDEDGDFQDPNLLATYQVVDVNGIAYGDGNPRTCKTSITADNPVTTGPAVVTASTKITFSKAVGTSKSAVWGFKVTLLKRDKEASDPVTTDPTQGVWVPVTNWNGRLFRAYKKGNDDYTAYETGLAAGATAGTDWEITTNAAGITGSYDMDEDATVYDQLKVEVAVVNMDGVISSAITSPMVTVL